MKRTLFQKAMCLILSVTTLLGIGGVSVSADSGTSEKKKWKDDAYYDYIPTLEDMQDLAGLQPYEEYISYYQSSEFYPAGRDVIEVDITSAYDESSPDSGFKFTVAENTTCTDPKYHWNNWEDFLTEGATAEGSIYLPSDVAVSWNVAIPEGKAGMYYISFEYYVCTTQQSGIGAIERKLLIDGKVPFSEVSAVTFDKAWIYHTEISKVVTDTTEADGATTEYYRETENEDNTKNGYFKKTTVIKDGKKTVTLYQIHQDITGSSMKPEILQDPKWTTYACDDPTGSVDGNLAFYLAQGTRKITLEPIREPVVIKSIKLIPVQSAGENTDSTKTTYQQYITAHKNAGAKPAANGKITVIEAEFPNAVSDSSIVTSNDRSSAITAPQVPESQLHNVIGKAGFDTIGNWAQYKFSVDKTGLYKISMRYIQDMMGMFVSRTLKLSGGEYGDGDTPTVPFAEAYALRFDYDKNWQSKYIGGSDGTEYEFYFEAGVEYTLHLECSLGGVKEIVERVDNAMQELNDAYLQILQLTGPVPDAGRDYKFKQLMPEVLFTFLQQSIILDGIKEELVEMSGTKSSRTNQLESIVELLSTAGANGGINIPKNLEGIKTSLGTLGTWVNDARTSTLMLDQMMIIPSDEGEKSLAKAEANFFQTLWFEICAFFCSFFTKYDYMGMQSIPEKEEEMNAVNVWFTSGRDQANIWRTLLDAQGGFTDLTNCALILKLTPGGALLPSILAGKGPDVTFDVGASGVIDYAIRSVVIGMTGNDPSLTKEQNKVLSQTHYYMEDANGKVTIVSTDEKDVAKSKQANFTTEVYDDLVISDVTYKLDDAGNIVYDPQGNPEYERLYTECIVYELTLNNVTYAVPTSMDFAMMFYRTDILATLGLTVPETWDDLLEMLPTLQTNNMDVGVTFGTALNYFFYQYGGNIWKYTDPEEYDTRWAGAQINFDDNTMLRAFEFAVSLYTDHSLPYVFNALNRFRTGEMPLIISDYNNMYNSITVYGTELNGMWGMSSVPGTVRDDGTYSYTAMTNSAGIVLLQGAQEDTKILRDAWTYCQWHSSSKVQSDFANSLITVIGPASKTAEANLDAIQDLSWTADERAAIKDQIKHLDAILNYPGSYIYTRFINFAFYGAVNDGENPVTALKENISTINAELTRKRKEFGDFFYNIEDHLVDANGNKLSEVPKLNK